MKKLFFMFLALISLNVFAHAPILELEDLNNGYLLIQGGYSNGESAEGTDILILKDKPYNGSELDYNGKLILFQGVLDKNGELTIPKPKTSKYIVVFEGGPGHVEEKKGPKLTKEEMSKWEKAIKDSKELLGIWIEKMQDLVK